MALKIDNFTHPSLLQYFEPPENYIGSFAWVCGYSADPDFLNLAAEKFTGKTRNIRARDGVINMIIMLDKSNPQISMVNVPGVFHAGRNENLKQPFRLLHAKLAILHFRHTNNPKKFHLRLLVSTGNWTSSTLAESLDLICCMDLKTEDLISAEEHKRQIRADIFAAWDLIKDLRTYFPHSIVSTKKDSETFICYKSLENILDAISKPKGCPTRLLDNRKISLLQQLPEIVKRSGNSVGRNYLALGSGFFQRPHSAVTVPLVIQKIFTSLGDAGLLTRNLEKELFVNPESCQCVAKSIEHLTENGWIVRKANDPLHRKRSLHAKFIFSANQREGYNTCSNSWLYLGSGNLTEAGFTNKMSAANGNIEAGIVLSPGKLYWQHEKKLTPNECVDKLLPVDWNESSLIQLKHELQTGDSMPDRIEDFIAAPVSWFNWIEKDLIKLLIPGHISDIDYHIYLPPDRQCTKDTEGNWLCGNEQPSVVEVRWGSNFQYSCLVPVIDMFDRIAAKKLNKIQLDEVWWQLDGFPNFAGEEDDDEDVELFSEEFDNESFAKRRSARTGNYPIRNMMDLIEKIADKQTAILPENWKVWCNRLEQSLAQTIDSDEYNIFRKMNINPLSPLLNKHFRPVFAEDALSVEGKYYEDAINRIGELLHVNSLNRL